MWWKAVWAVWVAAGVALELAAVASRGRGDTLSEFVWWTIRHPALWAILAGFLIWLTLHLLSFGRLG